MVISRFYYEKEKQNGSFYLLILYCVLIFCFNLLFFGVIRNEIQMLKQWDVGWYESILKEGYKFSADTGCNLAFFPMFPYIWKWTGFDYLGISVFNMAVYLVGLLLMQKYLTKDIKTTLLVASLPSMFFCYVPYSESIFFLVSILILIGYKYERPYLIMLGLLLSSVTRSVAPIFLPAILVAELFLWKYSNYPFKIALERLMKFGLAVVVGLCITAYIQYFQTGKLFYFFEVQKFWNKSLHMPMIPFITWSAEYLLWLDGAALLCCVLALILLISLFIKILKPQAIQFDNIGGLMFSLTYMVCIGVITVTTTSNVEWQGGVHTSIYSINRYIFAVPFIIPFIQYITQQEFSKNQVMMGFCILFGFLSIFVHNGFDYQMPSIVLYMILFYLLTNKNSRKNHWIFIFVLNFTMQVLVYIWFLNGFWIG
jgi:hypothetical protein